MEYQAILNAPSEFWSRYHSDRLIACNGCGSAFKVAEHFPGRPPLKIRITCLIHDFEYQRADASWDAKAYCDKNFYNNMLCLIAADQDTWTITRIVRKSLAWIYFKSVVVFGGNAFWEGKDLSLKEVK